MSDPSRPVQGPARTIGVTPADLDEAAAILVGGGLVAMPTETVYGLAADATNGRAIAAIYTAKGRPAFNPLISHVASVAMAETCGEITPLSRALIERFWPGPLTLVVRRLADCPVSELATAGLPSIALRMPRHAAALGLIERVGRPLAAPSANRSESLSPTTARHVADSLGDRIGLILDGGPCEAGIESTIIALDGSGPVLLRPGAIARTEIESVAGALASPEAKAGLLAPGMMRRHYAPDATLRLNARDVREGEAFLAFGPPPIGVTPSLNLSDRGDIEEAAANLFAMLRRLDLQFGAIAVAEIPHRGVGEGINDRLHKGAAKKYLDSV
ncbi:MAG: L-threonylcarbamoyladenylate synthase [Alphaproteobacteria bacterium]|nr:L-threonylcarbamoyladenylate synthase [Alphaproteobacteria bacterium]